jgi:integrase
LHQKKLTVASFVEEWKQKYAEKELSPLTFKTYGHHLKYHILPCIGHIRVDQVKTLHLVIFFNDLGKLGARKDGRAEEHLSNRTIVYIYRVLQNIFKHAVDWQLIKKNPMDGTNKPKIVKKEMLFFEEEAQQVIYALYEEPQMWRLLCLGAMIGGFRRGELLALEWTDVDYENRSISINKSISLTENSKAIVKDPKTESSTRHVRHA